MKCAKTLDYNTYVIVLYVVLYHHCQSCHLTAGWLRNLGWKLGAETAKLIVLWNNELLLNLQKLRCHLIE